MAAPTPKLGLRVLEPADAADVPADLNQVTGILDDAVIDAGQGGHGGLPAAGTQGRTYWKNDRLHLMRDNGAAWDVVGQGPVPIVASLPGAPYDGQEVRLIAVAGPPRVLWHLRYNQAATAGIRWEFVGGSPTRTVQSAQASITGTGFQSMQDSGGNYVFELVPVPANGVYDLSFDVDYWQGTAGSYGEFQIRNQAGTSLITFNRWSALANAPTSGRWTRRMTINQTPNLIMMFRTGVGGNTFNTANGVLELQPVAIGG